MMGGRVAEEIFLKTMTTGAGNDIERATEVARKMVCEWGMSQLGPLTFGKKEEQIFLGRELSQHRDYSEATAIQIDEEVKKMVSAGYSTAKEILSGNRETLEKIAKGLIEREVLMHQIAYNLVRSLKQRSAQLHHVPLARLRFKGTLDTLRHWSTLIAAAGKTPRQQQKLIDQMLALIAADIVRERRAGWPMAPVRVPHRHVDRNVRGGETQLTRVNHQSAYETASRLPSCSGPSLADRDQCRPAVGARSSAPGLASSPAIVPAILRYEEWQTGL